MKDSMKSYILNFLLIIGLTAIALWFALKDHYREVMALLRQMSLTWFIIIMLWGIIYACVVGCIIATFAKRNKKDYTYKDGIATGFVGMFFSGITPSATGGQFAQAYILKKQGIKYSDGASILWADFIVYQTTMMIYVTILFFVRSQHFMDLIGAWFYPIIIGYLLNVGVIFVLWTVALFPKIYIKFSQWLVKLLSKLSIIKNKEKVLEGWNIQIESFVKEIKTLKHEKRLILKAFLLNVLRMTIQFVLPFFIMKAMGVDVGMNRFVDCLALSSFVLIANAFIPIPGASGGTELVFTALFLPVVKNAALASGVMILWRFSTYHMVMLVGAIVFLVLKRRYAKEKWLKDKEVDICE